MKIDPWLRLGRLPSDVVVFEHSFGLTLDGMAFLPYCSCGWIGHFVTIGSPHVKREESQETWKKHLEQRI